MPSRYIGRAAEMAALHAALADACEGRGRLVLLSGAPGIGKTRTCEEVAAEARRRGAQVLWARCYEGEGAPAFWPWVQVVRTGLRELGGDSLRQLLETDAADLAPLAPALRQHFPDLPVEPLGDSAEARFRLFDGVVRFLAALTAPGPALLVIDDLQGADQPSLLLLQFVARSLRELPLLVLATHREVAVPERLNEACVELLRAGETERVHLCGLSPAEIAAFVTARAGRTPSAELVRRLHERSEGNPLFVGELVRVLLNEGQWPDGADGARSDAALPRSVAAVIRGQLTPLSAACRRALRVAAVIGREFRLQVLAAAVVALGVIGDESQASIPELVDEGVAAAVLDQAPEEPQRFRFAHALIRETLCDDLSPAERSEVHRRVGEAIETLPVAEGDVAELAHHFAAAGEHRKAVAHTQRAADHALAMLAYEEAARLYELALRGVDEHLGGDEPLHCTLLLGLGEAQMKAGDFTRGRATLTRVAALARQLGLREPLMQAALHFGPSFWGYSLERDMGPSGLLDPAHGTLLADALAVCGPEDSAVHAGLLARLALHLQWSAERPRAAALARQALAMAKRLAEPAAAAWPLRAVHYVCWDPGNVAERLAIATELVQLADHLADPWLAFEAHFARALDLLELAERAGAEREIAACRELAARRGRPLYRVPAAILEVIVPAMEGRVADADRQLQQVLAAGEGVVPEAAKAFGVQLFGLMSHRGQLAPLEPSIRAAVVQFPALPALRCSLAYLYRELERHDDAREQLEKLIAANPRELDLPRDMNWLHSTTLLAEVCAFVGDVGRARLVYDQLAPYTGQASIIGSTYLYFGPVSHYLGVLATTLGEWPAARRHFEAALATNRRLQAWPWLARTQYEYALMLARRGADEPAGGAAPEATAVALLGEALPAARALRMAALEKRIADLLVTLSAATAPARRGADRATAADESERRPPADAQPVFHREGDYWTLTYGGRTALLRDAKGLHYIAHLLAHPGREFHVADLAALGNGVSHAADAAPRSVVEGDLGTALDARARDEYRRRVQELREEIDDATARADLGRAEHAREEIEQISGQLAAAYGLGGRARKLGDPAERRRKAVSNQIRRSLEKIRAEHRALAQHLANGLRTGFFCSYQPEQPVRWRV